MKTMKKLMSLVLVCILVAAMLPMPARAASTTTDSTTEELTDPTYNRVTQFAYGESYVIAVYANRRYYALSHNGTTICAVRVTVSNGKITSQVGNDLLWTYTGNRLSYENDGTTYYLYTGTTNNGPAGVNLVASATHHSSVSLTNDHVKVGNYYLRFSGGTIKAYSTASKAYLFQQTFA